MKLIKILFFITVILSVENISAQDGPVIDLWYGDELPFGQIGTPQRWVNIQGNVSDPDGISSFYYTLNGGTSVSLSIGPDGRRLQSSGDFNVDLDVKDLVVVNTVLITAIDNLSNQTQQTLTIDFSSNNVWPLPDSVDWQALTGINNVAHVVDGDWEISDDGIRTATPGYDRLIAIGDTTWADYEITVPIIIHSINNSHGVGILLRWMGHTDNPVTCAQPKCGWLPLGAICWYRGNKLEIYGNGGSILATQTRSLDLETPYMFKARVETNPDVGGQYSFKVWGQGEAEPAGWDITGQESLSDPQNGSLLLISHLADVTFGNPSVNPIPISITNVQATVHSGDTSATISWSTNVPASSQVKYGLDANYGLGTLTDPSLKTSHSLELTGLAPNTEYHYQITSVTAENDEAVTGDKTFTTVSSDIVSDDFHLPLLNTSLWTYVDPVGDCSYDLVGSNTEDAWLNFNLPAGVEHQIYTSGIKAPHVYQECNNADFEVEAKFEAAMTLQYQEQGILVQQDDNNYLRFEFYSKTDGIYAYVAGFNPGLTTFKNTAILTIGTTPLYMRVKRETDLWTMTYSTDGISWTQAALFNFAMTVNKIGPYAGNAVDGTSPAFTGSIDYFFNVDSPIDPEDPVGDIVVITSSAVTEATVGELYTYDVQASGNPAPTFSLITAPSGMTIDGSTGLIEWIPDASGYYDVSVEASNTIPSTDIQEFVIHVLGNGGSPVSDDFSAPLLNPEVWTFVDPLGDSGYYLSGNCTNDAWINISVPGGSSHELWTNGIKAPHILQECGDNDFELEVKFESSVSGSFQEQGILIKQDEANFLRFEFYSTASNTKVLAAILSGTTSIYPLNGYIKYNDDIGTTAIAPLYMRVNRSGDQWTQTYSFDGINWNNAAAFTHPLQVAAVGTYAGNASGLSSPAHTSSVDYFFNTAAPVSPEDALATILGNITYFNTSNTPLQGVNIELQESGSYVDDVNSDVNGDFFFNDICQGDYSFVFSYDEEAVSINSTDAAQVNYWSVHNGTIPMVRFLSGDVNGNQSILAGDAAAIQQYFITSGNPAVPFASDWVFWKTGETIGSNPGPSGNPTITITEGSTSLSQNFHGMVTGDFNRSFTPGAKETGAGNITLIHEGIIEAAYNETIELPILAGWEMKVGAISLILGFPSELMMIENIFLGNDPGNPVPFSVAGDELRVSWHSLSPVYLKAGERLLTLMVTVTDDAGADGILISLAADPLNELADGSFDVIPNALLAVSVIHHASLGTSGGAAASDDIRFSNQPNPFRGTTGFFFSIPAEGKVSLEVYDLVGARIKLLVDETQPAGEHLVKMEQNTLLPGVYAAVLKYEINGNVIVRTIKIIGK